MAYAASQPFGRTKPAGTARDWILNSATNIDRVCFLIPGNPVKAAALGDTLPGTGDKVLLPFPV